MTTGAGDFVTPPERPAGVRPLGAPGQMGVHYEERVDFARLRGYRMARARAALEASECGAFLLFDFYNIRYTTQTWIGGALGDKMIRYALVFRDRDTDLVGLRLGGAASQALLDVAAGRELPARVPRLPWRGRPRGGPHA